MNKYFERYAYPKKLFTEKPDPLLSISVVIPCFKEPDIISTLESLNNSTPVPGVEVIIIINEPEDCKDETREQNQISLKDIQAWKSKNKLNFKLLVYYLIITNKIAGVGMARKVGMDEAARRFEQVKNTKGVICCFDADATCEKNYLMSIYNHFVKPDIIPYGASIYYEHNIDGADSFMNEGIIQYELHLRYYSHALAFTGFPYPFQTVGSSMAVRTDIYQKVGGMNKRKAGEDFYFLHRVMPTGNFIQISDTVIYPSARTSDRVPFGTGKAMEKWQQGDHDLYYTYNLQSFKDLKLLFDNKDVLFSEDSENFETQVASLPESIRSFLLTIGFSKELTRLKKQSKSLSSFNKNWFFFFDGFKVLKYLHFARDHFYPNQPVQEEAHNLAVLKFDIDKSIKQSSKDWLLYYRQKDKEA